MKELLEATDELLFSEELLLGAKLLLIEDELAVVDEELLFSLLITDDETSELEYSEESALLEFSSTLVELVVLGIILEELGLLIQPLKTKAKAAIIIGNFLFFIIARTLYTIILHKKRLPNYC